VFDNGVRLARRGLRYASHNYQMKNNRVTSALCASAKRSASLAKTMILGGIFQLISRRGAALLLLCGICTTASAVTCSVNPETNGSVTVCRVELARDELQLVWQDAQGAPLRTFQALRAELAQQGRSLLFAMNAGMFERDYSPVGLFVADGRQLRALNQRGGIGNFYQQPNGVFGIDARGAFVASRDDYLRRTSGPRIATQSGPLLLRDGRIPPTPLFSPQSTSRRIRNGVCAPSSGEVAFAISDSPVTFFEFARFFRDRLRCRSALNLDGSISSLYAPPLGRERERSDLGPMLFVAR
jgi:uncharacterized protein YigE (DUF2233 family)